MPICDNCKQWIESAHGHIRQKNGKCKDEVTGRV